MNHLHVHVCVRLDIQERIVIPKRLVCRDQMDSHVLIVEQQLERYLIMIVDVLALLDIQDQTA